MSKAPRRKREQAVELNGPATSADPEMARKLAELKRQLEDIAGKKIDESPEQLAIFSVPVGSASNEENSQVLVKLIAVGRKFCVTPITLLDASGRSTTGTDGKSVFLLSSFLCANINQFSEPVFLLATPHAANACYTTMTYDIVANPDGGNDVQITAHAWRPNGVAAPNISFDWRCRVVSPPVVA